MPGALAGTRIIDFGQYIAGPLTGMLLADQGADVIKIDPPGGPRWKTPANATWNRGKRSILLDLKQDEDFDTARSLVQSADVVVENFRPGVMKRLGLGPEEMTRTNPGLVYCSLPGFASNDPRAGMPAYEGILGAATATFLPAVGNNRNDYQPVYTGIPTASTFGAFQAVVSITMALYVRAMGGVGQYIEVPLFDSMFATNAFRGISYYNPCDGVTYPFRLGSFSESQGRVAWNGFFECKDGRWLYFLGDANQNWRQFVESARITSLDAEGLTDFDLINGDPELAAKALQQSEALFKTRTAQEWEDLVAEAGSEAAICRSSQEWIEHPQARESQMVVQVNDPVYGKMLQQGINARMSRTPGKVRGPAPTPDQHREEILSQLGSSQPTYIPPSAPATVRAALEGVRVLDLCIEIAGPSLGRTLAQFGADVIKIDKPDLEKRQFLTVLNNDVNQGKRSLLLNLKTTEGRDVFWRLLENTDVVLQSYRAGKLEKLGLGYNEMRKRKPEIIYASVSSYGHPGPWTERPAHDPVTQSATGMALRLGGDGIPLLQPSPSTDYGTGFTGAYAVALALLHKHRTGEGQHVATSLAYTAMTLQSPFMQSYQGKSWDEPRGQDALGDGPLHRAYRGKDGWLFIGARESDLPRIAVVDGLKGIEEIRGQALGKALEERFLAKSVQTWVSQLNNVGVGAHPVVCDFAELMVDPWVQAHGLSTTQKQDGIASITTCGPAPRLSRSPMRIGDPAPKPGRDTLEILEEHGLGEEYQRLVDAGAVVPNGVRAN